jgi:hypothetical protein
VARLPTASQGVDQEVTRANDYSRGHPYGARNSGANSRRAPGDEQPSGGFCGKSFDPGRRRAFAVVLGEQFGVACLAVEPLMKPAGAIPDIEHLVDHSGFGSNSVSDSSGVVEHKLLEPSYFDLKKP